MRLVPVAIAGLVVLFTAAWLIDRAIDADRRRDIALGFAAEIMLAEDFCRNTRYDPARLVPFLARRGIDREAIESDELRRRMVSLEQTLADDTARARFCASVARRFDENGTVAAIITSREASLPAIR